jgi:hypothetical protein
MSYTRRGLGYSVNPTTIFEPGTGPGTGWLATPGDAASAITGPPVFQAPTIVPPPACSQDTEPGGEAFSAACIAQVLAAQQANMAAQNNANYQFDVATCRSNLAENNAQRASLGMPALPDTCAENTYGLTPMGSTGGVSEMTPDAAAILGASPAPGSSATAGLQPCVQPNFFDTLGYCTNPAGQHVPGTLSQTQQSPNYTPAPKTTPSPQPAPTPTPTPTPAPTPPAGGSPVGDGSGGGYVGSSTSFFDETLPIAGFNIPDWLLLAAAGVAAFAFMGGRR